jgi:hypothetical protein
VKYVDIKCVTHAALISIFLSRLIPLSLHFVAWLLSATKMLSPGAAASHPTPQVMYLFFSDVSFITPIVKA